MISPFIKAEDSFDNFIIIASENDMLVKQSGFESNVIANELKQSHLFEVEAPQPFRSLLFKLKERKENVKLTAAVLALALGPLGVHRLYLGTHPIVPVAYVLTLGGGIFILPFIDFVAIVFTKDITHYMDNKQFFMWVNKEGKE